MCDDIHGSARSANLKFNIMRGKKLMRLQSVLVLMAVFSVIRVANADEQMRLIAQSGGWVTMSHSDTMLSHPDVCVTFNVTTGVLFRASTDDGVQVRIVNKTWTLPVGVTGTIRLSVGKVSQSVDITSNTDSMVAADVEVDDLKPLLTEMDKQSTMEVVVGKAKPMNVSLVGSTVATNAFRTCAGIRTGDPAGGNNPFR